MSLNIPVHPSPVHWLLLEKALPNLHTPSLGLPFLNSEIEPLRGRVFSWGYTESGSQGQDLNLGLSGCREGQGPPTRAK